MTNNKINNINSFDNDIYSNYNWNNIQKNNIKNSKNFKFIRSKFSNIITLKEIGDVQKKTNIKKFPCICKFCGRIYFSGSPGGNNCTQCEVEVICTSCNENFILNKRYIDFDNLEDLEFITCTPCSKSIARQNLKGPGICTNPDCRKYSLNRNYYGHCEECAKISNQNVLNRIEKKKGPGNCVIKTCGKYVNERDSFGRCKECHDKWYKEHNSSPEMKIVQAKNGKKVTSERQKPGICLRCLRYKIKRNSAGVCSECMRNETLDNKKPGNCKCCGEYNEIRDTMGRCKRCRDLSLQDWRTSEKFLKMLQENGYITVERNKNLDQICEDCGKVFHSPFIMKIGPCCNPNLHKSNFEIRNGIMFYKDKELNIFIKDILNGKENINNYPGFSIRYGKVCYKEIDILTNEFLSIQGNFTMIDDIKYYKQILVEVISQKILDGIYNINDFPGFNIRFGRVCYYNRDIINDDIYIFNNTNFYTLNDLLYIYDNEINDYILYSKFKEKYSKNNNYDSIEPFIDKIQDKYSNAFIQPTYRSQNSTTWSGAKDAFELDLNQMEIGYFAYVKFVYNIDPITGEIDYNSIKPAVAGKSGTLIVNYSGTDVNFSEDEKDGPTRKMIQDGLISWCKSFILVIPTENECLAYEVERNLQKEYKLLGS